MATRERLIKIKKDISTPLRSRKKEFILLSDGGTQVRRSPEERLFSSLLEQYHYLRYEQPVGENAKYLVWTQGRPIACLAWSSAPRHLGSRDPYIGWSAEARRRNIRFIAYNTRFLILPWGSVSKIWPPTLSASLTVAARKDSA